jgi:hypothetical protein
MSVRALFSPSEDHPANRVGAVAFVLVFGLWNMVRRGSGNTSQNLMRLRVLLQFVAIVIVMITAWVLGR